MSWKASFIIIKDPGPWEEKSMLKSLGFKSLTKIKDQTFENCIYPKNHKVYIGSYNGHLLISASNIPFHFSESYKKCTEDRFLQVFPQSEIAVLALISTVNYWAYSIYQSGKKIRAKAGSSDDGIILDFGDPLPEELELLGKSKLSGDGTRLYYFPDMPEEEFTEDQVGEEFVFHISKRYFPDQFDCDDELLYQTKLSGYSYLSYRSSPDSNSKPWWKFW